MLSRHKQPDHYWQKRWQNQRSLILFQTQISWWESGGVCLFLAVLNVPLHSLCADSSHGPALSHGSSTTSCETLASPHPGPLERDRRTACPQLSTVTQDYAWDMLVLPVQEQGPPTWGGLWCSLSSTGVGYGAPCHCAARSTCVSTSTVGRFPPKSGLSA